MFLSSRLCSLDHMQQQTDELLARIRHCMMPHGDVACRGTWMRQRGEIRLAPDRPWLPFTAEQWFHGPGIDFRWRAWASFAPLIPVRVVDSFQRGTGALTVSLFGFVPIARLRGPAANKGEALRGLAELPWHPFGFSNQSCLSWEASDAAKLRATFDDSKTQVAAEFEVDGDGRVLGGNALRPRAVGKSVQETPWSGVFAEYRTFDRFRIPTQAEATWHLPQGPFTYWRGKVTDFHLLP